ncbi:FtsX-like permease family protein [Streptomonospora salina]|uniref:Putative ABC transport system permease protein n=1 Tax=Streptomonospora salina TaxID=104205 RepID=A0A841EFW8_9ACTN|nr:ABC transporter permease [Streptomonospora salina]MBB5999943.1 putative ABC transport system permease protein [Streptomonospora salina]
MMLDIAWKTLRARKGSFAGAFIALLCATALIAASGILAESGLRSSAEPHRYAAADAVVGGEQILRLPGGDFTVAERLPETVGLPADLVGAVGALEEVELAVGDTRLPLAVGTSGGAEPRPVTGHSWDTAPLGPFAPIEGAAPARAGQVALTAGLAASLGVGPGDTVRLTRAAEPGDYRVSGTVAHQDRAPGDGRGDAVFLHADDAARLAPATEAVDAIGVVAAPGVGGDELTAALEGAAGDTPVTVYTGVDADRIEYADVGAARGLLLTISGSFGGLAVLIALFVVTGTLALSINTRRRELAALRAIGSTPGQVLRMIGAEALLLSLLAGVLGCLPGIFLARAMRAVFAHLGVIPADLPLVVGPLPLVGAVLLTVVTAICGGLAAALRPAWANPVNALRGSAAAPRAPARWRSIAGMVCLVLGVSAAMTPVALRNDAGAAGTSSAALLLVIAVALFGPALLRPLVAIVVRPLRRIRVSGFLAAETVGADLRRLGSVLSPLVLAVGFTLSMVYTQSVLSEAVSTQVEEGVTADAVVTDVVSGGVGAEAVGALAELPETGAVTPLQQSRMFVPYSVFGDPDLASFATRGVAPEGFGDNLDPGSVDGDLGALSGKTVAMESSGANLLGADVGDELEVRLGDGTPATLRLVATYERGLGLGGALVPREVLDGHAAPPSRVLVGAAEGTSPAELSAALEAFTGGSSTLELADREGFADSARAEAELAAWVNLTGLGVILGYIAISVVNSLVMSTAARSREFALLRLVGATRGQVLRALRWEAWAVVVLAVVLGTAVALLPLTVLSLAFLGTPVPAGPPLVYVGVVAGTAVLGVCSVMLPVRLALRTPPVEAIGLGE